ncbi:DMT family transporter [Staphylococcus sp. SQ8-PEA]|uniref:DMT family transporter n=1 Tax=Staphylococcus marylandisciuri TaxID=2981529 RepID=A0ABT2QSI6_9STAP|nr:DMT family transporter [Staphylococcus marylandisciuri]MCU5746955.1 DMT family transporter [Staphylococcus marylandisciuri]
MNKHNYNKSIYFAFGITILLWASAFPVIKIALNDFKAEHLSALRLLIAAIILFFLGIVRRIPLPNMRDIPFILLLGFSGFTVYHTALSIGEYYVSAGVASLIVSTTPIFSALLATYFFKERFSKLAWFGSLIAFLGVALISLGNGDKVNVFIVGIVLVLLASFGESVYFTFQKKFLDKYGFIPLTIYTIITGALFMLIFLPESVSEMQSAHMTAILSVFYLGAFPTVIPYIALAYTIQKIGVSDATISLYLTPAISLILAYFMLGEMPTLVAMIGGIITLIGVAITSANAEESVDLK